MEHKRPISLQDALSRPVEELELSVRAYNCIKGPEANNAMTVGDLVQMSPAKLLRTKNFGRKSLIMTQEALKEFAPDLDLHLGMKLGPELEPAEGEAL